MKRAHGGARGVKTDSSCDVMRTKLSRRVVNRRECMEEREV